MPREKKFSFLPVRNEDLRRKALEDKDEMPYVRIQKPGLLVFPRKTLEHFNIKEESIIFLRFYIDVPKRALAFKFIDKIKAEEMKETKMLSVKNYKDSLRGSISIKAILNEFGEWAQPVRCDLDEYDDKDDYINLGKMNYFIIPIPKAGSVEKIEKGDTTCPFCQKLCYNARSLSQHKRWQHRNEV